MEFLTIFLIALALAADCFVVALGSSISMKKLTFSQVSRVASAFGIFQALMPALGWLAGQTVVELIALYDHWVAFALLGLVGGKMVKESFHLKDGREKQGISRGWILLTLSVATSIDALAVGLTFAFIQVNILIASLTIGTVALAVTAIGFLVGRKATHLVGKRAETIGGLILIGIGIKIVLEHVL